jgi:peroxin-2
LEIAFKIARILNFLIFINNGQYSSLLHRLLGIVLVYEQKDMTRMIGFEYLNRRVVWQNLLVILISPRSFLKMYCQC